MSTQDKPQDGTNPDDIKESTITLTGNETPEDLKAKIDEANKKLGNFSNVVARAKKAEEDLKILKGDPRLKDEGDDKKGTPDKKGEDNQDAIAEEMTDLRFEGYTKDEVKFIMANGGRKQLEDPKSIVSIAINASRQQREAEKGAGDANQGGGSEVVKGYTLEQLSKMSASELEKVLPHTQ